MSILKFPYRRYPAPGGFFYLASLPLNIGLPQKNALRSKRFDAVIDSGASRCSFHASIRSAIGLDVKKGEIAQTLGVSGTIAEYLHEITLYIPGGPITITAGFSYTLPIAGLLGMDGFFDHFKVLFDPTNLHVELERIYRA